MKKILAMLLALAMMLTLFACGKKEDDDGDKKSSSKKPTAESSEQPTTATTTGGSAATDPDYNDYWATVPKDPLADLDWGLRNTYEESFNAYYTPEEYLSLISKLKTALSDPGVEPEYAINEKLLFVRRTIDTYDKFERYLSIVDVDGNVITYLKSNWALYGVEECGDYFFVTINRNDYKDETCDVVNKEGKVISRVNCKRYKYDIGSGYIFFSRGNDNGYIMNDKGEVIELQYKSVRPGYGELPEGNLSEDDELGKVSEGLFYIYSKGNNNTVAYYYNTQGEVVIDLSTRAVNYRVTKMSDFVNGQARIEFVGANYKDYYVYIDKTGTFIGEPIEMQR